MKEKDKGREGKRGRKGEDGKQAEKDRTCKSKGSSLRTSAINIY